MMSDQAPAKGVRSGTRDQIDAMPQRLQLGSKRGRDALDPAVVARGHGNAGIDDEKNVHSFPLDGFLEAK